MERMLREKNSNEIVELGFNPELILPDLTAYQLCLVALACAQFQGKRLLAASPQFGGIEHQFQEWFSWLSLYLAGILEGPGPEVVAAIFGPAAESTLSKVQLSDRPAVVAQETPGGRVEKESDNSMPPQSTQQGVQT
jgi:hypothetical protein